MRQILPHVQPFFSSLFRSLLLLLILCLVHCAAFCVPFFLVLRSHFTSSFTIHAIYIHICLNRIAKYAAAIADQQLRADLFFLRLLFFLDFSDALQFRCHCILFSFTLASDSTELICWQSIAWNWIFIENKERKKWCRGRHKFQIVWRCVCVSCIDRVNFMPIAVKRTFNWRDTSCHRSLESYTKRKMSMKTTENRRRKKTFLEVVIKID